MVQIEKAMQKTELPKILEQARNKSHVTQQCAERKKIDSRNPAAIKGTRPQSAVNRAQRGKEPKRKISEMILPSKVLYVR